MNLNRCPPREALELLLDEQLDEIEHRAISLHVGSCSPCQATLECLTQEAEAGAGLVSSLRLQEIAPSASAASAPGTPARSFLAQLKQIPLSARLSLAGADARLLSSSPGGKSLVAEVPPVPGYEILKELGRGGMGVVYQARHLGLNRLVALKMILAGSHAGPQDLVRFRREADAVARLRHPHIVQIYDIGEAEGRPYFALEFVEEGSLVQCLGGEPQPVLPAVRLVETLARAIHHAHQHGIIHRDLKPANILLSFSRAPRATASPLASVLGGEGSSSSPPLAPVLGGEGLGVRGRTSGEARPLTPNPSPPKRGRGEQAALVPGARLNEAVPKITDFGLARRSDELTSGMQTGEVVGTPSYMAPEQATGKGQLAGPRADVYALGAILYEMLTGRPPFKGATPVDTIVQVIHEEPVRPSRLRPKLPRDLETLCLKCLEKDPRKRYASAEALAEDLRRFRQGKPIQARPVGAWERAWKWGRRRPLTAALLAGMILSVLLGIGGVTWQWQEATLARDTALAEKADKEIQRQHADRARIDAEKARGRAARDRERARSALYYSRISQTQLQWRLTDLAGAKRSLAWSIPGPGQVDRRGWEWHYLQGLFHADLFTLRHRDGGLGASVVYHPRERWIASVVGGYPATEPEKAGEVRIWDAASGRLIQVLPGPGTLHRLAVRPDGKQLALGATDGTVRIWEVSTGREVLRRTLHTQVVSSLAYSPRGRCLATASWDRLVKIADATTGEVRHVLQGHNQRVQSVAFDPNGAHLASGDWEGVIKIWDNKGRLLDTWHKHKSAVYCVTFSPDGQHVVSAGSNGNIKIWELTTGKVVQSLTGHAGAVLSVAFSPDGRTLAYSGGDSTVRVWDVEAGVERITFRGHTAAVEGIAFSPDGQRLVSVSPGRGIVKVWDLTRHPEYATFARTGRDVEALAFHANSKHLVSVTVGGKLQVWDAVTGVLQDERRLALSDQLVSPAVLASFAPGARWLAARSREDARLVKAWDVATGAEAVVYRGHTLPVACVRFSGAGQRLATGACDPRHAGNPHEIKVWDAVSGKPLATLTGRGSICTVAFRPDGRWLAVGCSDGRVKLLHWAAGPKGVSFGGHASEVAALAFSPNGRFLASAGLTDRLIKVWDLSVLDRGHGHSARAIHTLAAPNFVCDLAFSPDGRRLAAGSRDVVRLWDAEMGYEVLTLRGAPQRHWDPPFNPRVVFSPDGRRLAGTNWEESISIWDAALQPDAPLVARRQAARRRAADQQSRFWHLQEAEVCLEHKNRPAAVFHFQRLGAGPLPAPLQLRKERLAARLQNSSGAK